METVFTPYASLAGGGLIGLSAVMLMALLGRIMGATGILSGAVLPQSAGEALWRIAVLAGMITGPLLVLAVGGEMPRVDVPVSLPLVCAGGVLVGIGVSYGGGCTSGHGVCGMARLSLRSVVATLCFMCTTFITVFLVRHVFGG